MLSQGSLTLMYVKHNYTRLRWGPTVSLIFLASTNVGIIVLRFGNHFHHFLIS